MSAAGVPTTRRSRLGALVGGLAGTLGGRFDDVLSLIINVFLVLPGLPLMVVLAAWLPAGPASMTAVLVLTGWDQTPNGAFVRDMSLAEW